MESSDLSSGTQKPPEPDFGKHSPEPKRQKHDVLGDDYHPNVYIEIEVDGTGNDEEDMSAEAYLAYLGGCTADRPKIPVPKIHPWEIIDGTGNDEEDMSAEAYLAYLGGCTANRPKIPAPKICPWEIDRGPETTIVDDPMVFVGSHYSICDKSDAHPTIFCPYLQFFPKDGKLASNAPASIVGIMSGEELEWGPGWVVLDLSKMRE